MNTKLEIPTEVSAAYYPAGVAGHEPLGDGLVNTTLLVRGIEGEKSVLQQMGSMLGPEIVEDYAVVADHLTEDGWEVAASHRSVDGQGCVTDMTGELWRSSQFIESESAPQALDLDGAVALSGLLGALHGSLKNLEYSPAFSMPHFHDTPHIAGQLEEVLPYVAESRDRDLAHQLLETVETEAFPQESMQLIHGDPKINNALYRDGKPFTFVDWDTLMQANPLVDLGDLIRSVTSKSLDKPRAIGAAGLSQVVDAYRVEAQPQTDPQKFEAQARQAGRLIAVELGMRYMIDSVKAEYFGWDSDNFVSREAHNLHRAHLQWRTAQTLAI